MLMLECPTGLGTLVGIVKNVLTIIQILIPIGLIIFGTVDLGRAVVAGDEKQIKENQQRLLKRAFAAVLVFLIVTIVTFLMEFIGGAAWKKCWNDPDARCTYGVDPMTGDCNTKPQNQ